MKKKKLKFWYVTRVALLDRKGQSVQVEAMSKAFHQLSRSKESDFHFKLISTSTKKHSSHAEETSIPFQWQCLYTVSSNNKPNWFNQLHFLSLTFFLLLIGRPRFVFTRDILIVLLCWTLRLKVVYELHNKPITLTNRMLFGFLKSKTKVKFVAISNTLLNYYKNKYQITKEKIISHHDGVFVEQYEALRSLSKTALRKKLTDLPTDAMKTINGSQKKLFVCTGSLSGLKGMEYLRRIAKIVSEEAVLIHIGPAVDYPPLPYVEKTQSKEETWRLYFQECNNVHLLSAKEQTELIHYQMAADVLLLLVMPNRSSSAKFTSPLKLFEYMATGNVIFANKDSESVMEVLNDENAILLNFDDEKNLTNALKKALKPSAQHQKVTQKALMDVKNHYTWHKRAKAIYHFMQS